MATQQKELLGHPYALSVLAGTEVWERVSYYGFQSLLTLYMARELFWPAHTGHIWMFAGYRHLVESWFGPMSSQALATQTFGFYGAAATATPLLLGAPLGDFAIGRRAAILLGGLLLTAGHFCMAFDQSFLLALMLLASGAGLMRGNIAPQIGALYDPADRRRETAFQIYGAVINLGGFIGPILTGSLAGSFGWHVAFASAGVGMLVGLIWFISGRRHLPPQEASKAAANSGPASAGGSGRRAAFLIGLAPLLALFWVAQSQIWNTYNLWASDHVELQLGRVTIPVPFLQSIDSLLPFAGLPAVWMVWQWQARRGQEPRLLTKMALGCFIFALGTLVLTASPWVVDARGKTPLVFLFLFHLISNIGWLYFTPTVTTVYSRLAPPAVAAALIAVSQLAVSLGQIISGRLGGLYEHLTPDYFWGLHAAIVAAGGVLLLVAGALASRLFPELNETQST